MQQGEEENYFTLNNPSLNNKPQSTTASILQQKKSSLLNRRQQNSTLPIQPLELPPLSQLLPAESTTVAAPTTIAPTQMDLAQPFVDPANTNDLFMTDPATAAAAAAAAAAALNTVNMNDTTNNLYNTYNPLMNQQQQPMIQPNTHQRQRQLSNSSHSSSEKQYSFVTIPGTNQKKRPRRRYDEIERLYHCNWPGCTKAYGTLNHLNAHVSMQKHGPKRQPGEFREMRKEWRRQKKEREAQRKRQEELINQQQFLNGQPPFPMGDPLNPFY